MDTNGYFDEVETAILKLRSEEKNDMMDKDDVEELREFYKKRRKETQGDLYWSGAVVALDNVLRGFWIRPKD